MFDVAYSSEANILCASAEKQKLWDSFFSDGSEVHSYSRMCSLARMCNIIDYHSILFYTHGERA